MEQHINSWGNSLGIRIPKAFSDLLGFEKGSAVDMSLVGGGILIKPVKSPVRTYRLEELLEGMTSENLPEPVNWGSPVGREIIEDDWS